LNTCPVANESVPVVSKSVQQLGPKIVPCLKLRLVLMVEEHSGIVTFYCTKLEILRFFTERPPKY